jgi:hypothetical protein
MKQILFFCFFLPMITNAQIPDNSKRDFVWPLGYDFYTDSLGVDAVTFDFSNILQGDTIQIIGGKQAFEMNNTNVAICTVSGKLDLYSNGCDVGNSNKVSILGNYKLNNTNLHNLFCANEQGYTGSRIGLMLPDNYDTSLVHLFFTPVSQLSAGYRSNLLLYSRIKKNMQSFDVETIDSILIQTPTDPFFNLGHLSACLHGNGYDWWVLTNLRGTSKITKYLISKNKITGPDYQEVNISTNEFDSNTGNSVFSPDGKLYADYGVVSDLKIFNFDRCTGLLSSPIHISIKDSSDIFFAAGVAFSNNSRYLYAASSFKVYQFDMEAADIAASKIVVAEWDGFNDDYDGLLLPMLFYQMQLAPDNKIYCTSPGGRKYIHIIENPDLPGLACNFKQHAKLLPTPITGGLPNFPYYRLGASEPPCAVAVEDLKKINTNLIIYPNPASDFVKIILPESRKTEFSEIQFLSPFGQLLKTTQFQTNETTISVADLPAGLVFIQILENGKIKAVGKLVIAR